MEPSPSVYCQTIARNIISGVLHTLCSAHQGLYLQRGEVFINCRQIQPSSGLPVAGNHFAVEIFRQPCCKSNSRLISPDIQEVCQFDEHKTPSIKTAKLQGQRIASIVIWKYEILTSSPGVNLLLAIVLFGTIVGDMLPVTNTTPLIGGSHKKTNNNLFFCYHSLPSIA